MIGRLFERLRGPGGAPAPMPEPDRLTYAVGDVHGRADLLLDLLGRIAEDATGRAGPARIVFVGDYVDRGPESAETLDILASLAAEAELDPVFLMGNHERMMLDFLGEPETGRRWLRVGGAETLASYGIAVDAAEEDPKALARHAAALSEAAAPHLAFLARLVPSHLSGTLFCTHAGADPQAPPDMQDEAALLWGDSDFRRRPRADGLWTVHGHFVVPEPELHPGRIAIDTGAWFTDRLTAARIGGGEVAFLST